MKHEGEFERSIARLYSKAPHIPTGFRRWLAQSAWWLTLLFVLFAGIGAFGLLFLVALFGVVLTSIADGVGAAFGGLLFVFTAASMLFLLVSIILAGMAISPLRARHKRGWRLLFYVLVLNGVVDVLSLLLHQNVLIFLGQTFILMLLGYVLFEIRSEFSSTRTFGDVTNKPADNSKIQ